MVFGTLLGPEESGAGTPNGCLWLFVDVWVSGLMCLLVFDFWIVDASIARTVTPGCSYGLGVVFVWVFVFVVCVFAAFIAACL